MLCLAISKADFSFLSFFHSLCYSCYYICIYRYKESITKSTKGWKEKLFSRNSSATDSSSEVRGEVNVDVGTVSRLMEHLENNANNSSPSISVSTTLEGRSVPEHSNLHIGETTGNTLLNESTVKASCAATSASD